MKRNWYNKKYNKWTGKDLFTASLVLGGLTTFLCSIPIIGAILKEKFDI